MRVYFYPGIVSPVCSRFENGNNVINIPFFDKAEKQGGIIAIIGRRNIYFFGREIIYLKSVAFNVLAQAVGLKLRGSYLRVLVGVRELFRFRHVIDRDIETKIGISAGIAFAKL